MCKTRSRLCFLAATLALVVVAGAGAASATMAHAAFSGNVCSLLTAKQIARVHVSPSKCAKLGPLKSAGLTNDSGTWGSNGPVASHLAVTIVSYTNATLFAAAKRNLGVLPGSKKVPGLGSIGYASGDGTLANISFVAGKAIVNINLRAAPPLTSLAPAIALAKTLAGKL